LLPTPSSQEPGFKNRTPVTKDGETPTHGSQRWYDAKTGRLMQKGLMQVAALLPTPGANDSTGGETMDARDARDAGGPALCDIRHLLPTPRASDNNQRKSDRWKGDDLPSVTKLLPRLPGEPTNPRSDGGNESADSQPPDQLTIEDD